MFIVYRVHLYILAIPLTFLELPRSSRERRGDPGAEGAEGLEV